MKTAFDGNSSSIQPIGCSTIRLHDQSSLPPAIHVRFEDHDDRFLATELGRFRTGRFQATCQKTGHRTLLDTASSKAIFRPSPFRSSSNRSFRRQDRFAAIENRQSMREGRGYGRHSALVIMIALDSGVAFHKLEGIDSPVVPRQCSGST
jgi:hypothetical protein